MAEAKRDENSVPTLMAVSSVDGLTPVTVYADPVTHRLLVSGVGGISGDFTTVDGKTITVVNGIITEITE